MTKEFFKRGKQIAKWADNNMTKDEALKILLDSVNGDCYVGQDRERSLVKIIREALEQPAQEVKCNPHPDAPHGFMRDESHSQDRYVCECEYWTPPAKTITEGSQLSNLKVSSKSEKPLPPPAPKHICIYSKTMNQEYPRKCIHCGEVESIIQPAQEPVALLEALSDLEHQQWMKWAQSIMDSEPISDARKQRWATMMVDYKDLPDNIQEYDREWARKVMALYTRPAPAWQGLSDDEIDSVWFEVVKENNFEGTGKYFARAIEQALKEKNNAV